jgi:hypothetical protein
VTGPPFLRLPLAAVLASLAAGPLTMLLLILPTLAVPGPQAGIYWDIAGTLGIATAVGFMISFIPNLLGTCGMFQLAKRWRAARLRRSWAAAGAAGAFPLAGFLGFSAAGPLYVLLLGAVGACCAAMCHLVARPD